MQNPDQRPLALVTGGAGFIGSHIVERLQSKARVRILDNLRTGRRANLSGLECEFVLGSVTDAAAVRAAMQGVDYVFHLAAFISVAESMEKPAECTEINTLGTLHVLEAARQARVRKVVFSSSAAVYGERPENPKHEDMPPLPLSPYAVTKLDGELYADIFRRHHGLATACLRYFNVYGPRQDPKGPYAAAVPAFIARALAGDELVIHGDGEQTRDFVFVRDIAAANVFAAMTPDVAGVFNAGSGRSVTINQLATNIRQLTRSNSRIVHGAPRPGDVRTSLAAVDRLSAAGFSAQCRIEEGLRLTVAALTDDHAKPVTGGLA